MLLQIHDELVRRQMIGALDLKVPLKVDLATGPNWLDVEGIR
jgi:DNA polymerase I